MSLLHDVAERDGWRCWVCDEPVDPDKSVNDPQGPSVDRRTADRKAKVPERLAHRGCNSRKGAVKVAIAWPDSLYVVEPAPLLTVASEQGGKVVLFTDTWLSPAAPHAEVVLPSRVTAPSPYDSLVPTLAVLETVVAGVITTLGDEARSRMQHGEDIARRAGLY